MTRIHRSGRIDWENMIPLSNLKLPRKNLSFYWHPYYKEQRKKESEREDIRILCNGVSIRSMSSDEDVNPSRERNFNILLDIPVRQKFVKGQKGMSAIILLIFLI
jgi:hypothetical protein